MRRIFPQLLQLVLGCVVLAVCSGTLAAQATIADSGRISGLAPDAQITGGVGLGVGNELHNHFLGRVRLGFLYGFEPYMLNIGVTGEVGALARLGLGGEVSFGTFNGPFGELGLARTHDDDDAWLSHVTLGYMIFGLEWQQRYTSGGVDNALLLMVRAPIGTWLFVKNREEKRDQARQRAERTEAAAGSFHSSRPVPSELAAGDSDSTRTLQSTEPPSAHAAEALDADKELQAAHVAADAGDHASEAEAFERAYVLEHDAAILLRIADARVAQGRPALGYSALQRFVQVSKSAELEAKLPEVNERMHALEPSIAKLRVSWSGGQGDEEARLDGRSEPGALLGYDVPIDVGDHQLVLMRGAHTLTTRQFHAQAGELVRVELSAAP